MRFRTSVFFDLLLEQSIKLGRINRQLAPPMVETALSSLAGLSPDTTPVSMRDRLRIRGWIRLGHARRLAFDLPGAEEALNKADSLARIMTPERLGSKTRAEILDAWAGLRWFQRRLSASLSLADDALELLVGSNDHALAARIHLLRADILIQEGSITETLQDLEAARKLASLAQSSYLELTVRQTLLSLRVRCGLTEVSSCIDEEMARAEELCNRLGAPEILCQVRWLRGYRAREHGDLKSAGRILEEVLCDLADSGQTGDAALAALELALVRLAQGRRREALSRTAEALVIFEMLEIPAEQSSALAVLRQTVETRRVERTAIEGVYSQFAKERWTPANGPLPAD